MKAVIQRVLYADVTINKKIYNKIEKGLLVFLGIKKGDSESNAVALAKKIVDLRIFQDTNDKMNLSLNDVEGEALIISQFTLCTDDNKSGNRPSFTLAEKPEKASLLYEYFIAEMKKYYKYEKIFSGVFAADMKVNLINDGPVTIILEKD